MKRILFSLMLIASFISSKATVFTLVIATVDTAYAHYVIAGAIVDSDQVHIAGLGAIPQPPTAATANNDWNSYVSSLNTYDSAMTAFQDSLAIHMASMRTSELTVLGTLGYNSIMTNTCVNQWIKVQGSFTTAWIGFSNTATYLQVIFTVPEKPFPNY